MFLSCQGNSPQTAGKVNMAQNRKSLLMLRKLFFVPTPRLMSRVLVTRQSREEKYQTARESGWKTSSAQKKGKFGLTLTKEEGGECRPREFNSSKDRCKLLITPSSLSHITFLFVRYRNCLFCTAAVLTSSLLIVR
mmetsp:Transcript_29119/g.93661  ORF Transcript_29119/g.93661 Transcript_29119/m.93661 type:complete len:136 (+) Transcript_29119:786-1193(+)